MKLLVIDDEVAHASYLKRGLTEEGFVVDVAHNGIDGLHLATEIAYDLVVLDVMLPGIDGLRLLTLLRQQGRQMPVLMLTARIRVEDRVQGLRVGADDYLVKPYAFTELVARIQGLIRRSGITKSQADPVQYRIADLHLDPLARRATRAGRRLDLTVKEFNLLLLLLQRRGEVVSRTEIAEKVWDINFNSGTNAIDVVVGRLRAKLDNPFEGALLHTVRGMGYVIEERAADQSDSRQDEV